MKKFYLFISLFLLLFYNTTFGQTISVNPLTTCDTVKILTNPTYAPDIIIAGGFQTIPGTNCAVFGYPASPNYATPRHWLEMKQANGTWLTVQGGTNGVFDNYFKTSTHGTYRVKYQIPRKIPAALCGGGAIEVLESVTQNRIGWKGEWFNSASYYFWSNEVIIGATQGSDITWNFIDPNGNNLFEPYPTQSVVMNTTGTKNYKSYIVSIFENGGLNRYWTTGWINGQIPGNQINLNNLVGGGFFQIPISYTVQFAISNDCNTVWSNLDRNFSVCPAGLGCRIVENSEIQVFPNPTNSSIQLNNIDLSNNQNYILNVIDMNGKLVKNINNFHATSLDLSDLTNGLYIINIFNKTEKIYSGKISKIN